ncbi:MAG: ABC transporter permease [Gallionellaceae bacterium CG1_02_56_997]|nr:MAG: ABC transporter permease [Gallionellaceae bacterium CG1_02_56_997]
MNLLRLSFNLLRRDWRAGEWRVLLLALVLAVGSLATVGLFADRVRQALSQQATALLGADLRITSTRPFSPDYRQMAETRGLRVVGSRTFPSMVSSRERVLLAEIQAVEAGYPLRGKMEVTPSPSGEGGVARGTVWADARIMRQLDLRVGDEVGLGAGRFIVAARVVKDVDQSIGFASFAPRVLMNDADLAATGLLQEGSRISYRLMVAGDAVQVRALRAALQGKLTGNEKLEDVTDARPEIRTALERAEHFLGLAALTAAILAGAAMALAARRFVLRHLDGAAVMRCLGAQQGQVLRLFLYQFLGLGLLAVLAGGLLGYMTQAVLVERINALRVASLPQPGVLPAFKAAVSGMALLLGFAFLPLLQLRRVSPLRVIRRELGAPQASVWLGYGLAALVLAGLFLWQAGSLKLGLSVLGGLLAGLLVFGLLARALLQGLARYAGVSPARWRQVFNNLARHGRGVALQIVALSLGGMALLLLTLVRADLLASWQGKLPVDAPNRFMVSIQPDQRQAVLDFFARQKLPQPQLLPMVRGRLTGINDRVISGDSYPESRARALVEREFNLSYSDQLPAWNELVSGRWWRGANPPSNSSPFPRDDAPGAREELSVEEGVATTLGIHLGDKLTFDVAGSRFVGRVTSLRRVQWDSMKVNFFVIATPALLEDYPASYLSSFYLPPDKLLAGDALVRQFPNLLVIDTTAVIAEVRGIIEQISQTISVVFLFTLLGGGVVLYAGMLATQDERAREAAIMRTLGADSAYLRRLHRGEFIVIGALSGLFAAAGATLLGRLLAVHVLEIPYRPGILIWLVGVLCGVGLVVAAGWLNTRKLAKLPPMGILRGE